MKKFTLIIISKYIAAMISSLITIVISAWLQHWLGFENDFVLGFVGGSTLWMLLYETGAIEINKN